MEENFTTETTTQPAAPARPTFLTVLCILTWISSGFGVLGTLLLMLFAGALGAALSKIPGMSAMLGGGIGILALALLGAGGKVFAAIQMWKLKKMGFFIYVGCELLALGVSAYMVMDVPKELGGGFPIFGAVLSAAFITMYGLNLKHMK